MRRPALYLAGLLLATGASLALAGPAQAAVSHDNVKSQGNHWYLDDDECDEDYDHWYFKRFHRHHHNHHRLFGDDFGGNNNSYRTSNNGISLLSGNIGGLL